MQFNNLKSCLNGFMALLNVLLLKFESAESNLNTGIEIGPEVAYNYGLRAYVRIRLDDFDGAIADCTQKLELKPQDASIYALRGWAYYCKEEYENAVVDLKKAIEIEPKRLRDYQDSLRLIDSYQQLGADSEAVDFSSRILEHKLEDFFLLELYGRRSISFYRMKQFDNSLSDIDNAIGLAGLSDKTHLHKMKADILSETGLDEKAELELDIYNGLKQFEAQITEWVPASLLKRTMAQCLDGVILAFSAVVFCSLTISVIYLFKMGGVNSVSDMVSLVVPTALGVFVLAFFDSLFVCLLPSIIIFWLSTPYLIKAGYPIEEIFVFSGNVFQDIMLSFLIFICLASFVYQVWFPCSIYQATPGKLIMKIKLTSSEGGKLRLGSMAARQLVRGLEALVFCLLLSLLFYLLNYFDHIGLKIFVSIVMLAVLGTAGVAFIKPGLHNILSSSFVSDVSLFFNKQSDYFRQDA